MSLTRSNFGIFPIRGTVDV